MRRDVNRKGVPCIIYLVVIFHVHLVLLVVIIFFIFNLVGKRAVNGVPKDIIYSWLNKPFSQPYPFISPLRGKRKLNE